MAIEFIRNIPMPGKFNTLEDAQRYIESLASLLSRWNIDVVVPTPVVDARLAAVSNSGDATTDGLIDAVRDVIISHKLGASS